MRFLRLFLASEAPPVPCKEPRQQLSVAELTGHKNQSPVALTQMRLWLFANLAGQTVSWTPDSGVYLGQAHVGLTKGKRPSTDASLSLRSKVLKKTPHVAMLLKKHPSPGMDKGHLSKRSIPNQEIEPVTQLDNEMRKL